MLRSKKNINSNSIALRRNSQQNVLKKHLKTQSSIGQKNIRIERKGRKKKLFIPWISSQKENQVDVIKSQIIRIGKYGALCVVNVKAIFQICQEIVDNVYLYKVIERSIKQIVSLATRMVEDTFIFKTIAFAGILLFQYSSFSLSLYYIDKALKTLYTKSIIYDFQRYTEAILYKTSAQILLRKGKIDEAKDLAYRYLRKTWYCLNKQQQMIAYDFLGRIELQDRNIQLSKYFHSKMCKGVSERPQIIKMSCMEFDKLQSRFEYFCREDITRLTRDDKIFNEFLKNHYQSQAQKSINYRSIKPQFEQQNFVYTHRSMNRIINNRHSLERHLNYNKNSNEIHLVKPKETKKIQRIITQFSKFVFSLDKKLQNMIVYQNFDF